MRLVGWGRLAPSLPGEGQAVLAVHAHTHGPRPLVGQVQQLHLVPLPRCMANWPPASHPPAARREVPSMCFATPAAFIFLPFNNMFLTFYKEADAQARQQWGGMRPSCW